MRRDHPWKQAAYTIEYVVLERINECKTQSADDKEQIITSESHVTSQRQRANGDLGVLLVLL
jgi:hypothetical protein